MIPLLLAAAVAVSSGSYDLPPGGKSGEVVRMGPGHKTEWVAEGSSAGPSARGIEGEHEPPLVFQITESSVTVPAQMSDLRGAVMVEETPRHFVWRSTAEVCDPAYWRGR